MLIMRKATVLITVCIIASMLVGCASIPDMSEEQGEMVSQYAAALMLKYDAENHSRLVDTDDFINEYNAKKQAFDEAAQKYLEEQLKLEEEAKMEEEERKEEAAKQEEIIASGGNSSGNKYDSDANIVIVDGGEPVNSNESIDSYVGVEGFSIQYSDIQLVNELINSGAFDVSAAPGCKLLVVSFDVTNTSTGTKTFDMLNRNANYSFSINNGKYISAKITFSDDDLAQAYISLQGGETRKMVLLADVEDGINIENLSLKVEIDGKSPIIKILK